MVVQERQAILSTIAVMFNEIALAGIVLLVGLDKSGVLDKILKRNGKSNATKNDIDYLANNHFHELKEQNDKAIKLLETIVYNQTEQNKISTRNQWLLEEMKK